MLYAGLEDRRNRRPGGARTRDGGFTGPIAKISGVEAIAHTFTIDADGVLQDEHVGDASIEAKLKKLVARAREIQAPQKQAAPSQ